MSPSAHHPRHLRHTEICAVLQRRGIVVMRTDTVYGLHGVAPDTGARLAHLKGRDEAKRMLVLVADAAGAEAVTGAAPPPALAALWPGPLTIVLPVAARSARGLGVTTLGVRVPGDPALRAIVAEVGKPIYSTSANRAGEPPLHDHDALQRAFGAAADLLVYDGPPSAAQPSTVVDATVSPARVVRAGALAISPDQLAGRSGRSG
ncbi:MAG: L-threonylcarbamoyladenylate synthase [Spirochaetaceae bacterium]|nr:L-threonylcarbamoyladenylate synthase [Spirochaetaceae bacterium]